MHTLAIMVLSLREFNVTRYALPLSVCLLHRYLSTSGYIAAASALYGCSALVLIQLSYRSGWQCDSHRCHLLTSIQLPHERLSLCSSSAAVNLQEVSWLFD